jgi:NAD(P)H-hydrate epimerase
MRSIDGSSLTYLDARTAKLVDDKLMSAPGYSIDQLMELAGYSVACATHEFLTTTTTAGKRVIVVSGPGNNGGDGLVAARHLKQFGYQPKLVYPKPSKGILFENLVQQCRDHDIDVATATSLSELNTADIIVDAIFGFSFKGPAKEPFLSIIEAFRDTSTPVLSVDVPSGWDVDRGDIHRTEFSPAAVISLTLPKQSMRGFPGIHYVGGRFVPPTLQKELDLNLPDYGFGTAPVNNHVIPLFTIYIIYIGCQ